MVIAAAFLIAVGCVNNNLDDLRPEPADSCDSLFAYSDSIGTILETNCTLSGCHDSGSPFGDFSVYSGIKAKVDAGQFQQRVLTDKNMPPDYSTGPKSLSECDLSRLNEWIANGAPE